MEHPIVLIVEDVDLLMKINVEVFEEAGYATLCAQNGDEAFDVLERVPAIDLLLTDIRLPGRIDGWDIAERARMRSPDLPVIYVTGFSSQEPRRVEGSIMLMKPFRPSALLNAARTLGVG